MKRTPLIITILIIIISAGAIWFYQNYDRKKITPWDLIGSDAAIVLELNDVFSFKEKLDQIPSIGEIVRSSNELNRILNYPLLRGSKLFITIHPISIDDFGFIVYSDVAGIRIDSALLKPKEGESVSKREYNSIEITELKSGGKTLISYALAEEIILLSNSPFLLEGALRLRSAEETSLFRNSNSSLFRLPTLKSDAGNVYLSVSNFLEGSKIFLQPDGRKTNVLLLGSGIADLQLNKDRILMNGFVVETGNDVISLFNNQEPQALDFDQLVSNNVSSLFHFGFSNPELWFNRQQTFSKGRNTSSIDSLENELSRLSVNLAALRKSVGSQMAVCQLSKEKNDVVILKLSEEVGEISVFDELSSKFSAEKNDSLYVENYAGYQIKLIDYRNLLYQLFFPLLKPSSQSYFVRMGPYLLLSENVELIKMFIDDIDSENTWGKSVEWTKFFSTSLQESNIGLFYDGKLASVYLKDNFKAKWWTFIDSTSFLGMDKGSIQLSRLESNFYLNASFQFSKPDEKVPNPNLDRTTYDFGSQVIRPPSVVRSHITRENELIIQDAEGNLYLLSKNLDILWKRKVSGEIDSSIEQIDFYSNGKLQYFFVADNTLEVIDRLGRNVEEFPKKLKNFDVEFATVVDYDRSKRYRYLLTDVKGNLLLADKVGAQLDGWEPRVLGGKLISSSRHYRVLGKDYFIAVQQNGIVNLLNRRGEMIKGFPLDLATRPMGDYYLSLKSNLSSTYFTVVSNEGMKIEFGLDGQIKRKESLIKRVGATNFSLVKSKDNDSFVFLRVDSGKLAVLDQNGVVLFEFENPGSTNWSLTYLENRLKERFYCFYDKAQNFTYFSDSKGQLLLPQPLESTQLPAMYYDEKLKSLTLFNVFNSRVSRVSIKK